MRPLRPNSRGAIVPGPNRFQGNRAEAPFSRPSAALRRLDQVRQGGAPNILIVRSRGGIGDVMMTTPTVKAIAAKYNCQVDYCTDFLYLDGALPRVLEGIPYIREVFDEGELAARKEDYDAVINLTCPCIAHEIPMAPPINRVDLFARHAGVTLKDHRLDYVFDPKELEWAREYLVKNNLMQHRLVMVQGSSTNTRRDAPFSKVMDAINKMTAVDPNLRFLIVTHQSDNVKVSWDLAHSWTLNNMGVRDLSAIMSYCDLVICPDSAVLHMAAAQQKKTVTIFGPTDPRARVNYHPEAVAIWPAKNLHNYPCWYKDPHDGYMCWKILDPEMIVHCCHSLMNNSPLPSPADVVTFGGYKRADTSYEII